MHDVTNDTNEIRQKGGFDQFGNILRKAVDRHSPVLINDVVYRIEDAVDELSDQRIILSMNTGEKVVVDYKNGKITYDETLDEYNIDCEYGDLAFTFYDADRKVLELN